MTEAELAQRIERWEDRRTEVTLAGIDADDLAAEVVAFANAAGGDVIVGVTKDRRIVADPDHFAQFVDNVCLNNCVPPIPASVSFVSAGGGAVAVISVPKGEQRPYRTNRGIYYVRTASGRRPATREELLRLRPAI